MGELGDLLAAQPGDAAPWSAAGQRCLLHAHPGALGPQEGGELVAPVDFHGSSLIVRAPAGGLSQSQPASAGSVGRCQER